jgi:outer membrane protein assembly factor BamB
VATNPIRIRIAFAAALVVLGIALAGCGGNSSNAGRVSSGVKNDAAAVGNAPPEWTANASAWPAHNYDLSNTRATTHSAIDSQTVSKLNVKWRFAFKGASAFGIFASAPIVLGGTVYLQDLNSNVYALDRSTGKLEWRHAFNKPSIGPNGVAIGYGRIYGATETSAFALDPATGKLIWSRKLTRNNREGIDMAPQVYDNTVLVSTVPGNGLSSFYQGGALGVVWALDAATGKPKWKFNTSSDGARLWGNPKVNSGGGLWYPPSVDSHGRVFLSVANPAPLYGTPKFPNGSSRPGPDLYTNSLVALDGQTGKLLWFRQAVPHDVRDYDLMIPAIIATVPLNGVKTEVVLVAGKMGKVYAYRADNGQHLWTRSVGKHENDIGPLPSKVVTIFPGDTGGVETPMALAAGRLFVPWLDLPTRADATGLPGGLAGASPNLRAGRGGLTAFDAASGNVLWHNTLPSMNFGAATVANDVVFTSDYAGTIYAFDTQTGKTLWTKKAPAGVNSFPAIAGDTLLVGAGTTGFDKKPQFELVAYSLSAPTNVANTQAAQPSTASSSAGGNTSSATGVHRPAIQVRGGEFFFRLSNKSAAKPGVVTFVFKNVGHVLHDFTISGKKTPLIAPGRTARLVVAFKKKGRYPYMCTVPGHAAAGMKGVFTVR